MAAYDPERDGDEEPIGGGSYNDDEIGSEAENFRMFDRRLFGYVETRSARGGLNTARLGAGVGRVAHEVLVIFVARHPTEGGQRVVGWYRRATCLPEARDRSEHRRGATGAYNIIAERSSAVLLPASERRIPARKGRGAMGQSNVFYGASRMAKGKDADWVRDVLAFVDAYSGPNALTRTGPRWACLHGRLEDYRPVSERASTRRPTPFSRDPNAMDRALRSHARLQNALAATARAAGFRVVRPGSGDPDFDLGWIRRRAFTVAEVKSLAEGNESHQLRYGLGQVLDYRRQLLARYPQVSAVLAIERAPTEERWVHLCRELRVHLVWPSTFIELFRRHRKLTKA